MTALFIISMLGIVILFYVIMCRIDRFIERSGIVNSLQGWFNQGALVYGAPDVVNRLQRAGINCTYLTEPVFPEDGFYSALFALSKNDDENLIICLTARHMDPEIYIIVRCNVFHLQKVFKAAGANRILSAGEPIDALLVELGGAGK